MPDLNIMQINTRRARMATKEIRQLVEERDIDILCIQEPYTRNKEAQGYPLSYKRITQGDKPGCSSDNKSRNNNNNHKST